MTIPIAYPTIVVESLQIIATAQAAIAAATTAPGPDTFVFAHSSGGPGVLVVDMLVKNPAGLPRAHCPVTIFMQSNTPVAIAAQVSMGMILVPNADSAVAFGFTDGGGVCRVNITGTATDTVDLNIYSTSTSPGVGSSTQTIPLI